MSDCKIEKETHPKANAITTNSSQNELIKDVDTISNISDGSKVRLQREMGFWTASAYTVGSIIGSGIFVSPKGVLLHARSLGWSMLIWAMCGLFSMLGALTYAELGTSIPNSGGDYAYTREAFGNFPAFVFALWTKNICVGPGGIAIMALTLSEYVLEPIFPSGCKELNMIKQLIAILSIILVTYIQWFRSRTGSTVQVVTTVTKVSALVIIIFTGAIWLIQGNTENFAEPFQPKPKSVSSIALAFYSGLWAYTGWDVVNYAAEEIKNYKRTLPLALMSGVAFVTCIYLLTNIAYHTVLTNDEILSASAVAVLFAEKTLGKQWSWIIPVFVAISVFGATNANVFCTSRGFFAGGREHHFPACLAMINVKRYTPQPALLLIASISCILIALGEGNLYVILNWTAFVNWTVVMISTLALLYIRWRDRGIHKPLKFPIVVHIVFLLCTMFLVFVPFWEQPIENAIGVTFLAAGAIVYIVFVVWQPAILQKLSGKVTVFSHLFLECGFTEEYVKEYAD